MKKGMTVVRAHAGVSVCVLLLALAVAGGGGYAVFAGSADRTGGVRANPFRR